MGRRHEMILAEGWHNADVDSESYIGTPWSFNSWPASFMGGWQGPPDLPANAPCGIVVTCANLTVPDWDDSARELLIREEGGQGSSVDQAQVKVREAVTCYRWIRPKDITDAFVVWPGAGGWSWSGIAAFKSAVSNTSGNNPPPNADPLTTQWLLGSHGQTFHQSNVRTSGLQHARIKGALPWNKRYLISSGGSSPTTWWLGIPTYQDAEPELPALDNGPNQATSGNLYGLKMTDADWVGYKDDPLGFYYDGWVQEGGWFGGYDTVFWLRRVYPNGHLNVYPYGGSGGFADERRLLRTDFTLPDYTLPEGVGIIGSPTWSTTNLDAKKNLAWFWEPRFWMRARKGIPIPGGIPADIAKYPAGDSDSVELWVWGEKWAVSSSATIGDPRMGSVQNRFTDTISHDRETYTWDGDAGDLPSMGSYQYQIRAGTWPVDGTGGTGPDLTGNKYSRLRCGPTYNITSAGSAGMPVGNQGFFPQTRPEKTDSPYEFPANMRYMPADRGDNVIPEWVGDPSSGPQVYTCNSLPSAWVVDDLTIDGIEFEVCTSKPHLQVDFTLGNW